MTEPQPFTINVSDDVLEDLKCRLKAARVVPNEVAAGEFDPNGAWAYGTDKSTLEEFICYWRDTYDWRKHEAELNSLSHFTSTVNDLRMHFIHERSGSPGAIPLLLVHGWPGSVVEFLKVIPELRDAGFDVVAPSIPGYGWSEAPKNRGANCKFMADQMHQLMQNLGYRHYVAQGGDWGSLINASLAYHYPEYCMAYHSNMCIAIPPLNDLYGVLKSLVGLVSMSADERQGLRNTIQFVMYESAYQRIQGTKPQSLAYGLNDSPTGLLAWILEKFQSWSDSGAAGPENSGLTKDQILTNVMVYWVTQTIASSCRLYYEVLGHAPAPATADWPSKPLGYVPVPTGVIWANDLFKFPRFAAELSYNLKHWSVQSRGGHFFALEQPRAFIADVVHFFKEVIDFEACKRNPPRQGQGRPIEPGRIVMYMAILAGIAKIASRWRSRL